MGFLLDHFTPVETKEEPANENERSLDLRQRRLVAGLTANKVRIASPSGDQEIHPGSDAGRALRAAEAGARCAAALLFNQAARGAGSQQWRSPASDVVKRRAFRQTELFPDRESPRRAVRRDFFAADLILLEMEVSR